MKFWKRSLLIKQKMEAIVNKGRLASLLLYIGILVFLSVLAPQDIVFQNLALRVFVLILLVLIFSWCSYKTIESMRGNPLSKKERIWGIGKWLISAFLSLMFLTYYLGLFRTDIWP